MRTANRSYFLFLKLWLQEATANIININSELKLYG